MKIKLSALVSGVNGSLNGSTATSDRSGFVLRNKPTFANRRNTRQQLTSNRLSTITRLWGTLSEDVRRSYNDGAKDLSTNSSLAGFAKLSGFNLFTKLSFNRLMVGQELYTGLFIPPPAFPVMSTDSLVSMRETVDTVNLNFLNHLPTGFIYFIEIAGFIRPEISYYKDKFVFGITGLPTPPNDRIVLTSVYRSLFGSVVANRYTVARVSIYHEKSAFISSSIDVFSNIT